MKTNVRVFGTSGRGREMTRNYFVLLSRATKEKIRLPANTHNTNTQQSAMAAQANTPYDMMHPASCLTWRRLSAFPAAPAFANAIGVTNMSGATCVSCWFLSGGEAFPCARRRWSDNNAYRRRVCQVCTLRLQRARGTASPTW